MVFPATDYRVSPSLSELFQLLLEGVDLLLEPVSFGQYVNHVLLVVSGCLFCRLLSMVRYLGLCVCVLLFVFVRVLIWLIIGSKDTWESLCTMSCLGTVLGTYEFQGKALQLYS
jgi:hypothetical protein